MPKARSKTANAIDLLKEDHEKVKKAFKEFEKMDRSDTESCRELVERVCAELRVHTTLEEEIVYPALREAIEDEDIMNEAAAEHERPAPGDEAPPGTPGTGKIIRGIGA